MADTKPVLSFKDIVKKEQHVPQVSDKHLSYQEWLDDFEKKRADAKAKKFTKTESLKYDYIDEHSDVIYGMLDYIKSKYGHDGHLNELTYEMFLKLFVKHIRVEEVSQNDSFQDDEENLGTHDYNVDE